MTADDLEQEFESRLQESTVLAFRVAYGVLRHRQDAEDVAQDALAKAHRHFRALRAPDRFDAWLVRIAWRLAIDRKRSDRRRSVREQAIDASSEAVTPEQEASASERSVLLWRAIDELPEKLRVVIVLAGIEEYDTRSVARLLNLPEGTVKSRLFLARRGLAERLRWIASDLPKR